MRQKLKKEWLQLANKYQAEMELEFADNSIELLQDSKYYLNSSNILPVIENDKFLPNINKKDNFYQSQININSNYTEKNSKNNPNKNSNQVTFCESNNNFYINNKNNNNINKKRNQKLNFNSVYAYNLKSESENLEKNKKQKENQNNLTSKNIKENYHSNDNPYNSLEKTKIKNNNNNINNSNEISTYMNLYNYNNSSGFKFNSSGENIYNNYNNLAYLKLDLYDLGQLLIYSVMGGSDLIDISNYECYHTRSDNCCCLIHCYLKYEAEKMKNSKLKMSEILKKYGLSFNFINFVCCITNFKMAKNFCMENLKEHLWLSEIKNFNQQKNKENYSKSLRDKDINSNNKYISNRILIELKEIFKIANELNSKSSIEIRIQQRNMRNFLRIFQI